MQYLSLLWTLRFNGELLRFAAFAFVGASGILVNSLALYLATDELHIYYLVSAAMATVASTLWNFVLTEAWVYRTKAQARAAPERLGLFFVVNVLALALRTPMIYALTSLVGHPLRGLKPDLAGTVDGSTLRARRQHYLEPSAVNSPQNSTKGTESNEQYVFLQHPRHCHGRLGGELPELEPFRVELEIQEPTIRVKIGIPRKPQASEDHGRYIRYRELFGSLGFDVGIERESPSRSLLRPSLRLSPHVLYTNVVEPLLRWTFVEKGYALVHGATLAFGDEACMITARTDTGKTTTLLKILAYQRRNSDRAAFLSDDMTVVSPDGMAMTYPKAVDHQLSHAAGHRCRHPLLSRNG